MDEKVYSQEIVQPNPFPGQVVEYTPSTSSNNPTGVHTPTTSKPQTFPTRKIAVELIGSALNTRSKKVLQEFELTQSGGFKVGDFKEGISGEVSYTPVGFVAKNKDGLLTIVVDGEDGSAVFAGEIRAGAFISGLVIVGDNSIVIDGETKRMVFYDDDGIPVIVIGNA